MKTKRCAKCQRRRPLKKLYLLDSEHWCSKRTPCTAYWFERVRRMQVRYRGTHDFAGQLAEAKEPHRFIYFPPLSF